LSSIAQVHALNIMRLVFRNTALSLDAITYIPRTKSLSAYLLFDSKSLHPVLFACSAPFLACRAACSNRRALCVRFSFHSVAFCLGAEGMMVAVAGFAHKECASLPSDPSDCARTA
jgi:hypothetical protein